MNMRAYLEERAFERDHRNCDAAQIPTVTVTDEETGEQVTIELPYNWEVCDVCDGKGTHVNPSIDCNGLSQEDFDEDPDFADDYRAGVYDVVCNRCKGRTTVPVVDESRFTEAQRAAYEQYHGDEEIRAACDAESRMERMMGA